MTDHQAHIYTCSVSRITDRLEVYGDSDLMDIALLKLLYKYSCYSFDEDTRKRLDQMVAELQMKRNDVCMDFSVGNFLPGEGNTLPIVTDVDNNPPVNSGNSVNLLQDDEFYVFSLGDFTGGFSDVDGHGPGRITVKSIPSGAITYDEAPLIIGQIIYNPSLLVYDRSQAAGYSDSFNFTIFDDYVDGPEESNEGQMTIHVANATNLPAEIGDNTVYSANRIATILTLEMFTSQLAPPYNDPENDLIDAIRIDEVSQANQGVYKLNGTEVSAGDIITREDLAAELFVHDGANVDTVSSDTFSFSARDEGSLIWVN